MKIVDFAKNKADFDLSNNYQVTRKDEFGNTFEALIKAQENIKELIKANSQDMSAPSQELSPTAEELYDFFDRYKIIVLSMNKLKDF